MDICMCTYRQYKKTWELSEGVRKSERELEGNFCEGGCLKWKLLGHL